MRVLMVCTERHCQWIKSSDCRGLYLQTRVCVCGVCGVSEVTPLLPVGKTPTKRSMTPIDKLLN